MDTIKRPVVVINYANRGRGQLANRILHPFLPGKVARMVHQEFKNCSELHLKVVEYGLYRIDSQQYLFCDYFITKYARMLRNSGVEELKFPEGTSVGMIKTVLQATTARGLRRCGEMLALAGVDFNRKGNTPYMEMVYELMERAGEDNKKAVDAYNRLNTLGELSMSILQKLCWSYNTEVSGMAQETIHTTIEQI